MWLQFYAYSMHILHQYLFRKAVSIGAFSPGIVALLDEGNLDVGPLEDLVLEFT